MSLLTVPSGTPQRSAIWVWVRSSKKARWTISLARSGSVWIGWERLLPGGVLSLRGETTWQSTVYYTPFNDTVQRQRPYGLADLNVEFRPTRQPWAIGAFVRNATNEDYITGTFSSPPPAIGGRPGEPRRAGLTFSIGYGGR